MIFTETKLKGAFIIEIEKKEDERGFFARTWDQKVFEEHGLNPNMVQCNVSFNKEKGTLRGMHFQIPPYEEAKLVRCIKGKIFEVMIDLRKKSRTYKEWLGIEMVSDDYKMLYVPEEFALGFQTLEDNTEVFYQMSQFYMPQYVRGLRWDDPAFVITWPLKPTIISKKDQSFQSFNEDVLKA